ncbi:hypothetical protein [Plebeiibacterium marinum]|uniref:Uncharacterized protein n=1 Tax=Plebeiibacterium marinum TaxID=2992111 RepID=A0AAE3SKR0_9BACT|nr:hypothetical protein [Plebeiobacterium marinum]MCW3806887.1 hypothetical protein [Plebeiobacterium marinum]
MIYFIIALVSGLTLTLGVAHKPILRLIAEKRAIPKIEKILFGTPNFNKSVVLETIHEVTSKRLSDNLVLDYFYKIKGLQVLDINKPINFWLKIYLTSPTKVRLNYFEQVKFYETFLNYPKFNTNHKTNTPHDHTSESYRFGSKTRTQLNEKLIAQKLA